MNKLIPSLALIIFLLSCGDDSTKNASNQPLFVDFEKPKGVYIEVSDVRMAGYLLKMDTARQVFENKVGKKIMFFPEEQANYGLVHCNNNGLIETIQECYDNHRPLILTPDVIWLAICQGVSIHINQNYNSLKDTIFVKNKPKEIVIRNDSLEYSSKHWKELMASFSEETKKYTRDDFYSFFVSKFSTTTEINTTAYQITLLESYKKAFDYVGESGCGIPSIYLAGTTEDWQLILKKLDLLEKIGLANWASNLRPIIEQFIYASESDEDKEFWQNIYKNASEYAAFYISGWIIKFFPYIKVVGSEEEGVYDEKTGEYKVEEKVEPNKFMDGSKYLKSTLSTDNFPSGLARIDVKWNNEFKGVTKKIEVISGFFAIKQYSDKSLEPFISWAICEKNAAQANHTLAENKSQKLQHNSDYWSPHFADKLTDSAVYDIKQFKTQSASLNYLQKLITDSLQNHVDFKNINFHGDTILIDVLVNGDIDAISLMKGKDNLVLIAYIKGLLINLPEKWFPALAHVYDVLDMTDLTEEENNLKVRANSHVKIGI